MVFPLGLLASSLPTTSAASYELISTTVLGSTQASITFTDGGAWTAYKHLQLRFVAKTNRAADQDNVVMQFNADTAGNYSQHYLFGSGSSVTSGAGANTSFVEVGAIAGNNSASTIMGAGVTDILEFKSGVKYPTVRSLSGNYNGGGSSVAGLALYSGSWRSTTAISSLLVKPESGTLFATGSRFSLYGVK